MPPAVRRALPHLVGRRPPTAAALWAAGGRKALSAGISVAVPLGVGVATGHADLGSAAALGGLTAIYGHQLSYRRRARVVAGCGAVLVLAVALGGLTGGTPWLLSVVLGLLAGAATAATAVLRIGPPGALGVVLVGGSASALGADPTVLAGHVAAAAVGALLAWVVVLVPWLWDPAGPERRAVAAAEAAVAGTGLRPAVVARTIRTADAAVAGGSRRRPSLRPRVRALEERFLRELPAADVPAPPEATDPAPGSRAAPAWLWTTVRITVGVTTAGLLAAGLGLASTYWASTTAVAVLLGTDARATRSRAVHRITGTLVGIGIAAVLLAADLPVGVEVAVVGLLLVGVELLVAQQYTLAVSFITPLSLLLVHVGVPGRAGSELITTRLVETLVGIALALAAGLLLLPRAASRRLPAVVTTAGARTAALVEGAGDEPALRAALDDLNETATAARAELRPAPGTAAWLHRGRWTSDLGWGLLAARSRGEDDLAAALATRVRTDG
ncbi:Fusaric acid resistance protein-like [Klenkia soli]|uniref:Fusaric acid resistance protein-like n=1 Tax=Klenkia soli TaxID=1052260 RepID=A0A1H0BGS2_9ACTN|nr:FUSC family protein [Klenkia soli]SDN44852.1 Fusaric acid resistance protein-like [Klenkia soli]